MVLRFEGVPQRMGAEVATFSRGVEARSGPLRASARLLMVLGVFLALVLFPTGAAARPDLDTYPDRAYGRATAPNAGRKAAGLPAAQPGGDLVPLGSLDLPGFNADVWGHRGFAYVGTWGAGSNYPARCPATGVRIVDLADPANPQLVGAVATIPGTSQEDVEVATVATPFFAGDLLVTGVQACVRTSNVARGMDLWDVSDPRAPRHLAFWASGPAGGGAQGVHELHLFTRGDRAYVAAAVPYSESLEGQGDFRLIDVTDPRRPTQVSDWGATIDGGLHPGRAQTFFGHSAWTNAAGTMAILSYWDAGAILLDIADPARPTFLGRTAYPAGSAGNTHSIWLAAGETVLLTADELSEPEGGTWGFLRSWDIRNPREPVEIGRFATPNAASGRRGGTFAYTIHNPLVRGTTAYLSWFGDGVRVVDLAQPSAPRELASFVPSGAGDPYGVLPSGASVWGVWVLGDLVLLSDMNAGLYVLRTTFSSSHCFAETGKCVGGRFLDFWRERGGLAINGLPISDELVEKLEDGREYTVQYFERTRLEYHPESPAAYEVQLGQFGRRVRPADPPVAARDGAEYFAETGHNLGGRFGEYWRANGGLSQFGYPLSEEFVERLEDGKEYRVQYFERARFEYHPENAAPFDVLLGQFGRRILEGR